ncbi:MAG: hypothetical protein CBC62_10445 [Opitutia bacterium TMED102]|nr:MAG: hypothetical protein CBC62_10445 [Opitutae bacterium TMED102]
MRQAAPRLFRLGREPLVDDRSVGRQWDPGEIDPFAVDDHFDIAPRAPEGQPPSVALFANLPLAICVVDKIRQVSVFVAERVR